MILKCSKNKEKFHAISFFFIMEAAKTTTTTKQNFVVIFLIEN